ncbi:hypothetical protein D3C84_541510 [compost metagenome]
MPDLRPGSGGIQAIGDSAMPRFGMTLQADRAPVTGLNRLAFPVAQGQLLRVTGLDCLESRVKGNAGLSGVDITEYPKIMRYMPLALFEHVLAGKQQSIEYLQLIVFDVLDHVFGQNQRGRIPIAAIRFFIIWNQIWKTCIRRKLAVAGIGQEPNENHHAPIAIVLCTQNFCPRRGLGENAK